MPSTCSPFEAVAALDSLSSAKKTRIFEAESSGLSEAWAELGKALRSARGGRGKVFEDLTTQTKAVELAMQKLSQVHFTAFNNTRSKKDETLDHELHGLSYRAVERTVASWGLSSDQIDHMWDMAANQFISSINHIDLRDSINVPLHFMETMNELNNKHGLSEALGWTLVEHAAEIALNMALSGKEPSAAAMCAQAVENLTRLIESREAPDQPRSWIGPREERIALALRQIFHISAIPQFNLHESIAFNEDRNRAAKMDIGFAPLAKVIRATAEDRKLKENAGSNVKARSILPSLERHRAQQSSETAAASATSKALS